jgi:hypothetical protein
MSKIRAIIEAFLEGVALGLLFFLGVIGGSALFFAGLALIGG